ncbi:hypothetical protein [Pigmentiphaga humi]|uniref:hypothetical protein n=1 Tax=Pigmentiphaga humi TaxID=2478468 RepID=UPI000F5423D5|nr:hypothetical protein [Pigmentiphaga humi]
MTLKQDINGMVIGDDRQSQRLVVGVGDTVARLVERNPFLKELGLVPGKSGELLRLPLMTRLDLRYEDGDLNFDVGCVIRANIDGNAQFADAAFIGMKLCEEPLNDWNAAVDLAKQVMRRFEQQNPQVKDIRAFYLSASEAELQRIGGWKRSTQELHTLLTPEEAKAKFAREAAAGHEEIVSGRRNGTSALIGIYTSEKAIFQIGVSKTANFGGNNLSEAQRQTMRYEVSMHFRLRHDVKLAPPPR